MPTRKQVMILILSGLILWLGSCAALFLEPRAAVIVFGVGAILVLSAVLLEFVRVISWLVGKVQGR